MARWFEEVKEEMKRTDGSVTLPRRATRHSAGYDFYSNANYKAEPNEIVKIWTDVKASMGAYEVLLLDVRSSMGGKWMLANTIGIIDADYYENPTNDGNIGIFLKNISNETLYVKKGDKIAQGVFTKFLTTIDDNFTTNEAYCDFQQRMGGFGSTD